MSSLNMSIITYYPISFFSFLLLLCVALYFFCCCVHQYILRENHQERLCPGIPVQAFYGLWYEVMIMYTVIIILQLNIQSLFNRQMCPF